MSQLLLGELLTLDLANVTSNLPENEAPTFVAGTIYNIGDEVIFDHAIYGCLVDGTSGKRPDQYSDQYQTPQYWQRKSSTNAYAAVDGLLSVASQNQNGDIVLTIYGFSNIAGVGVLDAAGQTATAEFFDSADQSIHTESITVSGYDFGSLYGFFFTAPSSSFTNYIFRGFPVSATKVTVTISGAPTQLGELVILKSTYSCGQSKMGAEAQIASRSIYEDNSFGVPEYRYRPGRVNASFPIVGDRSFTDALWGRLRALSGRRVSYEADPSRPITTGVGILRDVSVPVELPNHYLFTIEIEGVQ